MSSPEDEPQNTISSRDSSFFSLTSGNSVYFSAKDNLSSGDGSGEKPVSPHQKEDVPSVPVANQQRPKLNLPYEKGESGVDDESSVNGSGPLSGGSSTTLEEADSMTSFSDAADYSIENGESEDSYPVKRTPSTTSVEVKKGISRLCSDIANTDSVHIAKKKAIEEALSLKDISSLRKLAVSTGGLLSSKGFFCFLAKIEH